MMIISYHLHRKEKESGILEDCNSLLATLSVHDGEPFSIMVNKHVSKNMWEGKYSLQTSFSQCLIASQTNVKNNNNNIKKPILRVFCFCVWHCYRKGHISVNNLDLCSLGVAAVLQKNVRNIIANRVKVGRGVRVKETPDKQSSPVSTDIYRAERKTAVKEK